MVPNPNFDIYWMDAERGSHRTRIAVRRVAGLVAFLRLAFHFLPQGNFDIYVMDAERQRTRLTETRYVHDESPVWIAQSLSLQI